MDRRFLKQVFPLLLSLGLVAGLSLLVRKFAEQAPEPFERLVVEALPEIPELDGWPQPFIERLLAAHERLAVKAEQRDALVELAQLYHANGFAGQAHSCYLGLEAYEPENPLWPYLLAALRQDYRDKSEQIANLRRSLALDPSYSLAYWRLGEAQVAAGEFDAARESYQSRLREAPNDAWAMAGMGKAAYYAGDYSEAERWLQLALEAEPRLASPYELLPEALLELERYEDASRYRAQGRERASLYHREEGPRLHFLEADCYDALKLMELARRHQARGELGAAVELLERAMALNPGDREPLERLGEVVESLGAGGLGVEE